MSRPSASPTAHDAAAEYARSIADPEAYWSAIAGTELLWDRPFTRAFSGSLAAGDASWFDGGVLNACVNCVDRHLAARGERTALIWEGDEPGSTRTFTYRELHGEICRLANALQRRGVEAGDGVGIYLPTVPEAVVAMLACARLGAVHCVVFAGFGSEALRQRLAAADCRVLITADIAMRAGKAIALKPIADRALAALPGIHSVLVLRRGVPGITLSEPRELCLRRAMDAESPAHRAAAFPSAHPLFVLHTSGSTGTPKAVLHATAGSLLWAMRTHRLALDWREGEVYACVADIGWITGHSYIVYGPLGNGATTLLCEGVPTHPDPGRYWAMVEQHRVAVLFTVPTAVRAIARHGDAPALAHDRSSLRVIATAGEALDAATWRWLRDVPGGGSCAVIDIYGQTEAAGHLLAARPQAFAMGASKPGSVGSPLPGVVVAVLDGAGNPLVGEAAGMLAIGAPWPGLAKSIGDRRDPDCLARHPGFYLTGDGCRRDADGHLWITGRVDDVVNVSGVRLGTVEIEAALLAHPACAEAAVVGVPHALKGSALIAFAVARVGQDEPRLGAVLRAAVRAGIGPIAAPERVVMVPALPKTRSGKLMRRVLRALAMGDDGALGDLTALAEPSVIDDVRRALSELPNS